MEWVRVWSHMPSGTAKKIKNKNNETEQQKANKQKVETKPVKLHLYFKKRIYMTESLSHTVEVNTAL